MPNFTENDRKVFDAASTADKAEMLYLYLGCKYNMNDVASEVMGDDDTWASRAVSVITRGCGFSGKIRADWLICMQTASEIVPKRRSTVTSMRT